eukprot:3047028-Pyramimonas_sp.AAC.1
MSKAGLLRSEILFFSPENFLIRTEASADNWVELMEQLCGEGERTIITKLGFQANLFCGRPFALPLPCATAIAMAASRRRRGKAGCVPQLMDFAAQVRINGEPGLQDKLIIDKIMAH